MDWIAAAISAAARAGANRKMSREHGGLAGLERCADSWSRVSESNLEMAMRLGLGGETPAASIRQGMADRPGETGDL